MKKKLFVSELFMPLLLSLITISCDNSANDNSANTTYQNTEIDSMKFNAVNNHQSKEYEFVKIGNQIWMLKNLDINRFRNGDIIFHAKSKKEWEKAGKEKIPAWCYYDNNELSGKKYGRLYNWYAINDQRGLAPKGWKIPSENDWNRLISHFGGLNVLSEEMMSETGWANENGTNLSGFNAFPAGGRFISGKFDDIGTNTYYWSSSSNKNTKAICFMLNYHLPMLTSFSKTYGLSVRCLKEKK